MAVRMPRLLGSDFAEEQRLAPTRLSVKMNLTQLSTATMELPLGETFASVRRWVQLFGPNGSLGLFRVAGTEANYGMSNQIQLEHGMVTLGDNVTPADQTLTGTPKAILTALMGYQHTARWKVGAAPTSGSYTLKVDRSNLLTAVLDLLKQVNGYRYTFDFSTTPWTMNMVALEATPSCECRMSRNTAGVTLGRDDTDLCTRVYATGLTNGYMDADTVSTWGIVARSLGTPEDGDAEEIQAYATAYLAEYKNPRVSIEVDALDMAALTGETWDAFVVGKLCRVALPEWEMLTEQRVVAISYPDLIAEPERAQLSLCTKPRDLSHTLSAIDNDLYGNPPSHYTGGGGGGGSGDASGGGKLKQYNTDIKRNRDDIVLKAWSSDVDALDHRVTTAEASITVNANSIKLKVSKDGVISSINQTAEEIKIQASRVNLVGYVTATSLYASIANLNTVLMQYLSVNTVNAQTTYTGALSIGNDALTKENDYVLNGVEVELEKSTVIVKDIGGTNRTITYVTDVTLNTSSKALYYWQ